MHILLCSCHFEAHGFEEFPEQDKSLELVMSLHRLKPNAMPTVVESATLCHLLASPDDAKLPEEFLF